MNNRLRGVCIIFYRILPVSRIMIRYCSRINWNWSCGGRRKKDKWKKHIFPHMHHACICIPEKTQHVYQYSMTNNENTRNRLLVVNFSSLHMVIAAVDSIWQFTNSRLSAILMLFYEVNVFSPSWGIKRSNVVYSNALSKSEGPTCGRKISS